MEKKLIEEKIMVRILSDAIKSTNYLAILSDIIEDSALEIIDDDTLYTRYPDLNEYLSFFSNILLLGISKNLDRMISSYPFVVQIYSKVIKCVAS